jgi:hypothetical protein
MPDGIPVIFSGVVAYPRRLARSTKRSAIVGALNQLMLAPASTA